MATKTTLTRELYDAFQTLALDRWDEIVDADVLIDSPAGRGLRGRDALKGWAAEFGGGFAYQIDLVDEHLALDAQGDGRGFITFNLHWKHAREVFGSSRRVARARRSRPCYSPSRRSECTRIHVGDNSLDLVLYMWERGWPHPHNVRPDAVVRGVDRSGQIR